MSGAEGGPPDGRYGTIVVVGGGCYGSYYVRQLGRARDAGRLSWQRLLVADRDPACRAAVEGGAEVVPAEWSAFFGRWLDTAAEAPGAAARDAVVPSPLMPHLMFEWVLARARARWPGRVVAPAPLPRAPETPWERAGADGTHYLSFATWMCPINCVEPRLCPHTRGPRDWSMPLALAEYVRSARDAAIPLAGPAVFHCTHRAFGVGMFDVAAVLAADRLVAAAAEERGADVLVATVSHCHGAAGVLRVGAPAAVDARGATAGRA